MAVTRYCLNFSSLWFFVFEVSYAFRRKSNSPRIKHLMVALNMPLANVLHIKVLHFFRRIPEIASLLNQISANFLSPKFQISFGLFTINLCLRVR